MHGTIETSMSENVLSPLNITSPLQEPLPSIAELLQDINKKTKHSRDTLAVTPSEFKTTAKCHTMGKIENGVLIIKRTSIFSTVSTNEGERPHLTSIYEQRFTIPMDDIPEFLNEIPSI